MLLTKAAHSADFVRRHGLGVEFHVGRPLPEERYISLMTA